MSTVATLVWLIVSNSSMASGGKDLKIHPEPRFNSDSACSRFIQDMPRWVELGDVRAQQIRCVGVDTANLATGNAWLLTGVHIEHGAKGYNSGKPIEIYRVRFANAKACEAFKDKIPLARTPSTLTPVGVVYYCTQTTLAPE